MKNAVIIQGAGETPDSFWLPYVKNELEKRGYSVWLPQLPQNDHEKNEDNMPVEVVVPFLLKNWTYDAETVIVTHSAGGPIALALLEVLEKPIKQAILVAAYITPLPPPAAIKALQDSYDYRAIYKNCGEFIFINSDNDPYNCSDEQGRAMMDRLGGTLIVKHGEGHMGSGTYKQPYKEFPLLLKLIDGENWGK
jgi:predicted alpha/beta hydrolase family esterase